MAQQESAKAALDFWDKVAPQWDAGVGSEGNDYWTYLQEPVLARLCAVTSEDRALDLATGNGIVARWLSQQGVRFVVATDGSQEMIDVAKARDPNALQQDQNLSPDQMKNGQIVYNTLDICDEAALSLEVDEVLPNGFTVITLNMALMDIPDLKPLAKFVKRVLQPGTGRLVATMLHPMFFTSGASRCVEVIEDENGKRQYIRYIKVDKYLKPEARKVTLYLPAPIESHPQTMFHRPLQEILAPFLAEGLVLDALEEPNFDENFIDDNRPQGSKSYVHIPKLLAFRMRSLPPSTEHL